MTLSALIRKRETGDFATAIPAISATQPKGGSATVARIATVAVANPKEEKTAPPAKVGVADTAGEPFDREAWEERAAIAELDGGLPRKEAEALAWQEDDRRRCFYCTNFRRDHYDVDRYPVRKISEVRGVCAIAEPKAGALVVANRGYRPDPARLIRCKGYVPGLQDTDRRPGYERWPGLS